MKMVVSTILRSTQWASIFTPYWQKPAAENWLIHFMQSATTQLHRKLIEQANALCSFWCSQIGQLDMNATYFQFVRLQLPVGW